MPRRGDHSDRADAWQRRGTDRGLGGTPPHLREKHCLVHTVQPSCRTVVVRLPPGKFVRAPTLDLSMQRPCLVWRKAVVLG
jgi:hypothetical protein